MPDEKQYAYLLIWQDNIGGLSIRAFSSEKARYDFTANNEKNSIWMDAANVEIDGEAWWPR